MASLLRCGVSRRKALRRVRQQALFIVVVRRRSYHRCWKVLGVRTGPTGWMATLACVHSTRSGGSNGLLATLWSMRGMPLARLFPERMVDRSPLPSFIHFGCNWACPRDVAKPCPKFPCWFPGRLKMILSCITNQRTCCATATSSRN